jgi:hypothetical protein
MVSGGVEERSRGDKLSSMCDLAATGADMLPLLIVAGALVAAGLVALVVGRRTRAGALALLLIVGGFGFAATSSPGAAQAACSEAGDTSASVTIALSPASWDAGATSGTTDFTVTNTSATTAAVNIVGVVTGDPDFAVSGSCGASLAPGATCELTVDYIKGLGGPRSATLTVAGSNTNTLTAALTASPPLVLTVDPASADIPTVGTRDLIIQNPETVDATGFALTLEPAIGISIGPTTCGIVLAAGANCAVTVVFDGLADETTTLTASANGFTSAVATFTGHAAAD